ncbi:MAG: L-threonylcarbamoyladenylate synthase type 1 TsaC, partial [Planctomycetes bacterium]|nr:L-threonylcarbamoyladenylate synthase type 1 TsaC [Planctomycetota bacterium]
TSEAASPSPGMLAQHYAPRTPLALANEVDLAAQRNSEQRLGAMALSSLDEPSAFEAHEILAPDGDLTIAAAEFFAALRRLDAAGLDRIIAWPFPDAGLGRALNDRLRRARH